MTDFGLNAAFGLNTPAEAAAKLRISRAGLYNLKNAGLIKFTRIGGRVFVLDSELQKVIARGTK